VSAITAVNICFVAFTVVIFMAILARCVGCCLFSLAS